MFQHNAQITMKADMKAEKGGFMMDLTIVIAGMLYQYHCSSVVKLILSYKFTYLVYLSSRVNTINLKSKQ